MNIEKLFDLNEKDLLIEKENQLNNLRETEMTLLKMEWFLSDLENKLYLETDFKDLKLTNDKLRKSFVDEKTKEYSTKIDIIKNQIKIIKDSIELINNIITLRIKEE